MKDAFGDKIRSNISTFSNFERLEAKGRSPNEPV